MDVPISMLSMFVFLRTQITTKHFVNRYCLFVNDIKSDMNLYLNNDQSSFILISIRRIILKQSITYQITIQLFQTILSIKYSISFIASLSSFIQYLTFFILLFLLATWITQRNESRKHAKGDYVTFLFQLTRGRDLKKK